MAEAEGTSGRDQQPIEIAAQQARFVYGELRAKLDAADRDHAAQLGPRFIYRSPVHRARALAGWLRWYNRHWPHASLSGFPPASCVPHLRGLHI